MRNGEARVEYRRVSTCQKLLFIYFNKQLPLWGPAATRGGQSANSYRHQPGNHADMPAISGTATTRRKTRIEKKELTTKEPRIESESAPRERRNRKPSQKAREGADSSEESSDSMDSHDSDTVSLLKDALKSIKALQKEVKGLKEEVSGLRQETDELKQEAKVLRESQRQYQVAHQERATTDKSLLTAVEDSKAIMMELGTQLEAAKPLTRTVPLTYAGAAKSNPLLTDQTPQKPRALDTTPMNVATSLFFTVEAGPSEEEIEAIPALTRSGIQKTMRQEKKDPGWRLRGLVRDKRNARRVRIFCRDEEEVAVLKKIAERTKPANARVMRDQLFPVKMDNVMARAILLPTGAMREDAVTNLEAENDVKIAKISWLSSRTMSKEYGSMVVYFAKGEQAQAFLREGFFSVAGESAQTTPFLPRAGPIRCYKCQQLGHKTYSCKGEATCARCSEKGHRHTDCKAELPRCSACGGPHAAFSSNCLAQRVEPPNTTVSQC